MMIVVHDGSVDRLSASTTFPPREDYGRDWILVDAAGEDEALQIAGRWDRGERIPEMELFAAAYRTGAMERLV